MDARDLILKAINRRGYKKGSRSIKMTIEHDMGIVMNRKKIQRIMRKCGIVCPHRKPNLYAYLSTIKDNSTNEISSYHVSDRIPLALATMKPLFIRIKVCTIQTRNIKS